MHKMVSLDVVLGCLREQDAKIEQILADTTAKNRGDKQSKVHKLFEELARTLSVQSEVPGVSSVVPKAPGRDVGVQTKLETVETALVPETPLSFDEMKGAHEETLGDLSPHGLLERLVGQVPLNWTKGCNLVRPFELPIDVEMKQRVLALNECFVVFKNEVDGTLKVLNRATKVVEFVDTQSAKSCEVSLSDTHLFVPKPGKLGVYCLRTRDFAYIVTELAPIMIATSTKLVAIFGELSGQTVLRVYDISSKELRNGRDLERGVVSLAVTNDHVAVGMANGVVYVYTHANEKATVTFIEKSEGKAVRHLVLSDNFLITNSDSRCLLWTGFTDVKGTSCIDRPASAMKHSHEVTGLQMVSLCNGKKFLVTLADNVKVTLIDANKLDVLYEMRVDNALSEFRYRLLATRFELVLLLDQKTLHIDYTRAYDELVLSTLLYTTGGKAVTSVGSAFSSVTNYFSWMGSALSNAASVSYSDSHPTG